jgi:hypothetical protein
MILDVSRGYIKVACKGRVATIPGEMFFPPNDKIGFVIFLDQIKHWDSPNEVDEISVDDISEIIDDIRKDFAKGGHTLEIE